MLRRALTTDRVYAQIKQSLLAGDLPAGRLDLNRLADKLRVSPTPVREALARLAAEELVNFKPHIGYSAAPATEADLRDLYAWNFMVVDAALALVAGPSNLSCTSRIEAEHPLDTGLDQPSISVLCANIGAECRNQHLRRQILRINDQLARARTSEPRVIDGASFEAQQLARLWTARDVTALRTEMAVYHRRRMDCAALVARAITGCEQN